MKTNIKIIDDELEEVLVLEEEFGYKNIDELIRFAIYGDTDEKLIDIVEEISTYTDLEKGYITKQAVLYLPRIKKYFRVSYIYTTDEIKDLKFMKEVFCIPKKTVIYQ